MVKHCLAALAVSTALAAVPAWAQAQRDQPEMKGQFITTQAANQWRASKLVGLDIWGPNDEKVGNISEVLLDRNGNVHAVVVGVGGFLGIGTKDVALPFSAVKWVSHEEYARTPRADRTPPARPATPPTTGAGPDARPAVVPPPAGPVASPGTRPAAADVRNTDAYQGYPHHAVVTMTKDELKNAPEFRWASQMDTPPPATAPRR